MRNICLAAILLFLFWACNQKKSLKTAPELLSTPEQESLSPVDTVSETQYLYTETYDRQKVQGVFKAGKDVFKAFTESFSLNDSSLTVTFPDSIDGKLTRVKKLKCHNHVYKIRLTRNGNLVYQRQFTKRDFLKFGDDGFITESAPHAPTFRGVTADGRVLFDMWFCLPDSDFGGISFFATNLQGDLLQVESYSGTGGTGCDGQVHTSPNRRYFLSCEKLYGPNGYVFAFGKPDMVTAKFLTDTSFVALYNYVTRQYNKEEATWEETYDDKSNNLLVYHVNGKVLAKYRFNGITHELDYTSNLEVLPGLGALVLVDGEKQEIHQIPFAKPQESTVVRLGQLRQLTQRGKTPPGWQEVSMGHSLGEELFLYFAADSLSGYFLKKG